MKYAIKEKLEIHNPLVFICGPAFKEKEEDKRRVLRDFFLNDLKKGVLPIIVDNFLDKVKINDKTISIPLLEEICAAVSTKTYIFLDTFSSVSELGIFSSASVENKILVIIPKERDKLIENLNFFVREIYESNCNESIECLYYRPKITRVPIASDYVIEYYEFPRNSIPTNLADHITNDCVFDSITRGLIFNKQSNIPRKFEEINYTLRDGVIDFNINLRMFFYLVASIQNFFSINEIENIHNYLKEILLNYFKTHIDESKSDLEVGIICTNIANDTKEIIKHIIKFINLYESSRTTGAKIVTKESGLIGAINIYDFFGFTDIDIFLLQEYISSPLKYVENIGIKRGNKKREITKYLDNEKGNSLRRFHEKILKKILDIYEYSENSFAYRKGYNILRCVKLHVASKSFLKLDISHFFNSIIYRQLYTTLKFFFQDKVEVNNDFESFVKSLMYMNKLPLGLITSPLVSDIYLHEFDLNVKKKLNDQYSD